MNTLTKSPSLCAGNGWCYRATTTTTPTIIVLTFIKLSTSLVLEDASEKTSIIRSCSSFLLYHNSMNMTDWNWPSNPTHVVRTTPLHQIYPIFSSSRSPHPRLLLWCHSYGCSSTPQRGLKPCVVCPHGGKTGKAKQEKVEWDQWHQNNYKW